MLAQDANGAWTAIAAALIGAVVGGLGVKWLDIQAGRRDRRRERRQADLREVQEATEAAYAATGTSLGETPAATKDEASNLVLAANLRGASAAARIGDAVLSTTFKIYTVAIVHVVMGDRSSEMADQASAASQLVHQRIGELYREID